MASTMFANRGKKFDLIVKYQYSNDNNAINGRI